MARQHPQPEFHPDDLILLEPRLALSNPPGIVAAPHFTQVRFAVQVKISPPARTVFPLLHPALKQHHPATPAHARHAVIHKVHHQAPPARRPFLFADPPQPLVSAAGTDPPGTNGAITSGFINCIDMNPDLLDMNGPCSPG